MATPRATDPAPTPPLLIDAPALASLLGRSERSIWRDDSAGRIPRPIKLGGSKRWRRAEIHAWIEAGCPKRKAWESQRR